MEKVLIGCPVNERKHYCKDDYLDHIINLTYSYKEFYFVDNSEDRFYHAKEFVTQGFDCDWVNPNGKKNNEYICESQNKIRQKALDENFDYLFFCEQDVFPPITIIEQLLAFNAPVAVARYMVGGNGNDSLFAMDIEDNDLGYITNRRMNEMEVFLNYGKQEKSKMFGFGCCLIQRKILEQTEFFVLEESDTHSDILFYFWCHQNGIIPSVLDVICEHRNSDWSNVKDYATKN